MPPSPQLENGYTRIAHETLEALWRVNLSPYEWRVLMFLFRNTYGRGRKSHVIALSQFSKALYIDRRLAHRAIKSLEVKRLLVISKDDTGIITYQFQKDYSKWRVSSRKMTVISRDDKVSSVEMTGVSSLEIPSKDIRRNKRKKAAEAADSPFQPADRFEKEFKFVVRPYYPARDGDHRWRKALGHFRAARKDGEPLHAIVAGTIRYAKWCDKKRLTSTDKVKQAATFFGLEKCWREPWETRTQSAGGFVG